MSGSSPAWIAERSQPKTLVTEQALKLDPKPFDSLSKLPPKLLTLIARFYLRSSSDDDDGYFPAILLLTHINLRLRQIVIGTPDMWTSFGMSDAEGSFHLVRLCITRSKLQPLKIQLHASVCAEGSDLGDRFYDLLHPVASRIRIFKVYMTEKRALKISEGVLAKLELPTLKEIGLYYDRIYHAGFLQSIRIPGGANLEILTLKGLFPGCPNLSNLKCLTLTSAGYCKWSPGYISLLLSRSPSLQNLTFIGTEAVFDVECEKQPDVPASSLRYLGMKGGVTANFAAYFLLALHAPNLETVDIAIPLLRVNEWMIGAPVSWEDMIDQMETRFLRKETFRTVRSLVIDPEDDGSRPHRFRGFFRFLAAAFPCITSLDVNQKEIRGLISSRNGNNLLESGWDLLDTLTIRGSPSRGTLARILAFARARNGTHLDGLEGDEENSGEEYASSEEDDDETGWVDDDTDEREGEDERTKSEEESGGGESKKGTVGW
ncbi:hypothetical protein M407DRAFT_227995 [Tulasnella calospora MUT 4182]|uniref:F-box domain-containing protein n=1 Tax=Tulasnella calospora MUT 4182 TaxID=1051891 RepID=A0A0C3PS97_9AGAM|nr:hypothetical protein M407DRAFT_227995 [Tulasnella calospora MUT 4182]